MPLDALSADPCAWRYYDYPRTGSVFTLPDIPSLVRGPTVVLLPSGKEIRVPAQFRQDVSSPAEIHDMRAGGDKMQSLLKLLTAKQGPSAPQGFKIGRAGAFQTNLEHPRDQPRLASHQGTELAY